MTVVSGLSGWRLALRLAWREAWRAKGRSALVLVMVTFPVIAVVAADVAQATSSVSSVEGLDRRIGSSQALVTAVSGGPVHQLPDPSLGGYTAADAGHGSPSWTDLRRALGGQRPVTTLRHRELEIRTQLGRLSVGASGLDLHDPLTAGLFHLTDGRWPASRDEVAVNASLADRGFGVGDHLSLNDGRVLTVVGTAESASERTQPQLVGVLGLLPPTPGYRQWLVGGGPVTWDDVRAVNRVGAIALSRAVVEHPPSANDLPPQLRYAMSTDRTQIYTVLALVGVMALLEVVLLAGPAFAVGARRQSRNLALMSANGGTPKQSRRVILGSAVVLGMVGAVVGVGLGILLGRALLPLLQPMSDTYFGPFQIRWEHVLGIAAFGLLSAVLAAVVPAWIASRQDVVAVLAGRRGDRAASRRSPFVGLALLCVGVVLAVMGARQGAGDLLIAGAAVVSVFGMIFLVPVVVLTVARLGRRFPLPLRYAVRDAARHRTRTVPAVAAVAATVAGVVALSIANTSDQAQARAEYTSQLPSGMGAVTSSRAHPDWAALRADVAHTAPAARPLAVRGVPVRGRFGIHLPQVGPEVANAGGTFPSLVLIGTAGDPATRAILSPYLGSADLGRVQGALSAGRAVVFMQHPTSGDHVAIRIDRHLLRAPAVFVAVGSAQVPATAVLPPSVLGPVRPTTVGLLLAGKTLTAAQESDLRQVIAGSDASTYLYVERGYQVPGTERVVLWILFGLAGVLMLGGTLTATFLALSDARPDLATLSAVGATPRTRRGVASAYALSVGVVGALLGAAVGFIPGIAVTYPLTRGYVPGAPGHYLEIPWALILALVVALPLVTALVVGLTARSRLPLVARLD